MPSSRSKLPTKMRIISLIQTRFFAFTIDPLKTFGFISLFTYPKTTSTHTRQYQTTPLHRAFCSVLDLQTTNKNIQNIQFGHGMQGLRATHRGSHRFQHHGVPPAGPPKQRSSAADYGFAGEKGGSVEG